MHNRLSKKDISKFIDELMDCKKSFNHNAFYVMENTSNPSQENSPIFTYFRENHLSISEAIVFVMAVSGYSNTEIAKRLYISESTVRFHLKNIYRKTSLSSRTALIKIGSDLGL